MTVVVMGVSGAGKSAVGAALARRLRVPFCEGDDLHPAANVAKMRAGLPLTDRDRAPWLDRIARWIARHPAGVVSCSALKRRYRARLARAGEVVFVLLDPPRGELERRLGRRQGHFMPPALLGSQLATLERPSRHERAIRFAGRQSVDAVVAAAARQLTAQRRRSVARRGTRSSWE